MKLFRKESLEKVTSLEHLDKLLTVVGIKGWLILFFFVLLFFAIIVWAFWGTIPITASGKAIMLDPKHSYVVRSVSSGVVKEIHKIGGQEVKKGEVIVVLENDSLSRKVEERKKYVLSLEKEVAKETVDGFGSRYGPKKRELFLAKEELADLEEEERGLIVQAPVDRTLIWVDLNQGDRVVPNEVLISMQGEERIEDIKIFAFIPLGPGQLVKPGMPAKCALNYFSSEEYGMVLGKVIQIMPYPISPSEYYMQKIPSKPLREYLMGNSLSNILVVIKPQLDPATPSGLAWTSGEGPPEKVRNAMLGIARITLKEARPISYVLPGVEK